MIHKTTKSNPLFQGIDFGVVHWYFWSCLFDEGTLFFKRRNIKILTEAEPFLFLNIRTVFKKTPMKPDETQMITRLIKEKSVIKKSQS